MRAVPCLGVAALLLALALGTLAPASADWPQYGHDAGRRGVAEGDGPEWPDIAYQLDLAAAEGAALTPPIVVAGHAYFLVNATIRGAGQGNPFLDGETTLYRLDVQTGRVDELATMSSPLYYLAHEAGILYASGAHVLVAMDLEGQLLWREPLRLAGSEEAEGRPQPVSGAMCGAPLTTPDAVYVACLDNIAARRVAFVERFTTSGERAWEAPFVPGAANPAECPASEAGLNCYVVAGSAAANGGMPVGPTTPQLSMNRDFLYLALRAGGETGAIVTDSGGTPDAAYGGYEVHAIHAANGTGSSIDATYNYDAKAMPCCSTLPAFPPPPVGNDRWTYVLTGLLSRFDATAPRPGGAESERNVWETDRIGWGAGMVLAGDKLYAAAARTLYRFTLDLDVPASFAPVVLPDDETWYVAPMALAGDLLLASSHRSLTTEEAPTILNAIDAHTGKPRWRHQFHARAHWAVSDGVVVAIDERGLVTVIGKTAASLHVATGPMPLYPEPGQPIVVDLSRTLPGAFGAATSYRADWGDGTSTGWQPEPVFRHVYAQPNEAAARFFAQNDLNHTGSLAVTFYVGQPDPSLSIFNSPFHRDYQEATFFLLGLLATAILALVGVYRAGRKRRRLHQELRALEADHQRLAGDQPACEAMLTSRRARARGLFLEKKLEEAHASFLEKRVDDLLRGLRLSAVDETLQSAPHGIVLRLKRLLADARVDALERSEFLRALDQQPMPEAERERVRRLVEAWFARDELARDAT